MPPRGRPKAPSIAQQHAEWVRLLRPDGPFIAVTVLAEVFQQGLDTIPNAVRDRLRQAWKEVQAAPDVLNPAWCRLVLSELLRYNSEVIAEGAALPEVLGPWGPSDTRARPDGVVYGPDGKGGRAERMLLYRRPWEESPTKATKDNASPVEQATDVCRRRGTPLALVTNGRLWSLVQSRPGEPATIATFDADIWLEERDLLRAFTTLLAAQRVLPPAMQADGSHSTSLAALFARSAEAQIKITDTLGGQVREAVELLVGELARLDRESGGALLSWVEPHDAYRGALTVMMRLVFLLYAEDARLVPVDSDLYAESYSVAGLFDQLEVEQGQYGEGLGDRRAAAWPRLIATFRAVHGGSEHDDLRIPPYGGGLFDPERFGWLENLPVTDRVVHAILEALMILKQRGERLSYKGLDVEQIGHVYEGLLEFSCRRTEEPHVGLIGKQEAKIPLAELEGAATAGNNYADWLASTTGATRTQLVKGLAAAPGLDDLGRLDAACDNDHELAARVQPYWGLLGRDLRGRPTVFPTNSLIIARVGDRRATGTHYTPRSLAEEVVEHTLAPLCFSPGPAEGADPVPAHAKTANELLQLKVLDPAMGSGAFLVSACRYLGDRVVEAWERDGLNDDIIEAIGPDFDRDDLILEARRRVAARCIYGVDRDDMAVELAKLSLWLVTLAKDKPFSFLDHALRCGDSLVGLTSEAQIEAFHLDPQRGKFINNRTSGVISELTGPLLTRVQELREQIEAQPVRDAGHGEELARKLHEAERLGDRLRLAADAVVAAALSAAGDVKHNRRPHWEEQDEDASDLFEERLTVLADDVTAALEVEDGYPTFEAEQAEKQARELITPMLQGLRNELIYPLHWPLEFPEVMRQAGFDAVVSNPPFIGGSKVSGYLGDKYREFLVERIANGKRGTADLCAYFLLRDLTLSRRGRLGIIATNTIAQGDIREVGLDQAKKGNWDIYRAVKSQPWPGKASIEVSLVWEGHPLRWEKRILDGSLVHGITTTLDPESRVTGNAYRLTMSSGKSFNGVKPMGKGFTLEPSEARSLIDANPRNSDVIFPYLNGDDLNQRWTSSASRFIINFQDWPFAKALEYPEPLALVERRVKPLRDELKEGDPLRRKWWAYERPRPAMQEAIADLHRILVITQTSRTQMPTFVPNGQVLDQKLIVFPTASGQDLGFRSSAFQYWWTARKSSTRKTDLVYAPTDCCETLPIPSLTQRLEWSGEELWEFRSSIMARRQIVLTSLYDVLADASTQDEDIVRLREIHVAIDEAVREAYALDEEREPAIREFEARIASAPLPSWREIDLGHGFHETRQGVRFTISPQAQLDVLDKLLALNHYRFRQEQEKGLHNKPRRRSSRRPTSSTTRVEPTDSVDDALFPRPDTLF